jgi:hypothetical protein
LNNRRPPGAVTRDFRACMVKPFQSGVLRLAVR